MRKAVIFLSFVFLLLFSGRSFAQAPEPPPSTQTIPSREREPVKIRSDRQGGQKPTESSARELERRRTSGGSFGRRDMASFAVRPNKEQRRLLVPDSRDFSRYAAFLQQPRTGLFKLFPDAGCEDNAHILRVDSDCLSWVPTSAFYSFREREHTSEFLSDIRLKNNVFVSNSYLSQGILVALGDIPLESISLESEGMKFLVEYRPEALSREALKQFNAITRGIKSGRYEYRNVLPAAENMTYAIRTIAYRAPHIIRSFQGRLFSVLDGDKRVDMILAFRVIRKDNNGVTNILWKELDRKESPRIVFPKREKKKAPAGAANYQG